MLRLALVAAAAGAASAQTYTWNGMQFSLGSASAWMGANPFDPSNMPQYTIFGTANSALASSIPSGMNIDVGSRLEFHGQTTLVLGGAGGMGGNTIITFGTTGSRSNVGTVAPPSSDSGAMSPVYNYGCNLNWLVNGQIPGWAPCSNNIAQIPNNGMPYYVSTYGRNTAAMFIELAGGAAADRVMTCPMQQAANQFASFVGPQSVVAIPSCTSRFSFGGASSCPNTATVADACAPMNNGGQVVQSSIVSGRAASLGQDYIVITRGPFAGQVFQATNTGTINNVTGSVGVQVVTNPAGNTPGAYRIGNTVFGAGGAVVDTTQATTVAAGSSGGGGGGAGGSLLIIIIIVAVVVILVVVVVVVKKKNSDTAEKNAHAAVSFENPMYDGAGPGAAGVAPVSDGGLYQEPAFEGGDGTGGYMDVPAGGDDGAMYDEAGATGGYMDVPAQGESETGGYMDVNPEDEDDDDV